MSEPSSARQIPVAPQRPLFHSLRVRLLAATIAGLAVALVLAGFGLNSLFRNHVLQQFRTGLTQQLDQLTARLEFNPAGEPMIDAQLLYDPRWQRPYSGLYWQIDSAGRDGSYRSGVLRSRSLWDVSLQLNPAEMTDVSANQPANQSPGAVTHLHQISGPLNRDLMAVERTVRPAGASDASWRLIVASDISEVTSAMHRFAGVLFASLLGLFSLLVVAAWAQVSVGLKPLRTLQRSLADVQHAHSTRLQGVFPSEVQPLVDDFNRVLEQNRAVLERARTQAGNLAHALKTPLSILDQAASAELEKDGSKLAQQVQEQVQSARRHIDWHLARARVSAMQRLPGQRTHVGTVLAGIVRVMERVHANRNIHIEMDQPAAGLYFAGEEQDLYEMLGNLLDNACKWAQASVVVNATLLTDSHASRLRVTVRDDGPGIDDAHFDAVMARGVRLDETVAGTGLGLAIVKELAGLYGGALELQRNADSGLTASILLPATTEPGPRE